MSDGRKAGRVDTLALWYELLLERGARTVPLLELEVLKVEHRKLRERICEVRSLEELAVLQEELAAEATGA